MNARDVMRYGHETVLRAVDGLTGEEWKRPGVCGVWSTRQILAHLGSYEEVVADVLAVAGGPAETPSLDRFLALGAGFNDAAVAARDGLSPAATLAAYTAAHGRAMTALEALPAEMLRRTGTIPWYGDDYALDDLIVYLVYGHKREHCAEIAHARGGTATS